jgi:hypothetical protein
VSRNELPATILDEAEGNGNGPDFASLRERAGQAGVAIEVGSDSGGTRLAWTIPTRSG